MGTLHDMPSSPESAEALRALSFEELAHWVIRQQAHRGRSEHPAPPSARASRDYRPRAA